MGAARPRGVVQALAHRNRAAAGPTNMAVDEAVLEAVAAGTAPPTLRAYGWRGRWLSIGMAESIDDVDAAAAAADGVALVRRPSGGATVLTAFT